MLEKLGRCALGFLGAAMCSSAFGWIDTGHMIVADIAEKDLRPSVLVEARRLLKFGGDERSQDFLGAACWADDFKTQENGPWHYINYHFRRDGRPTANQPEAKNVVWAIEKFSAVLADKGKPDAERAEALRFILHFVGDIHQPLHTTACDSDEHPKGDRGGNDFTFDAFPLAGFQVKNLHFLWDIGGGLYGGTVRPGYDRNALDTLADKFRAANPRKSFPQVSIQSPEVWSREGEILSRGVVYHLEDGKQPSDGYLAMARFVSERQLTLAGYRLADLLNRLL